jgi:plasmid maintenance system antidote protein VapI
MEMDEWIWRNRVTKKEIAKACDIPYVTLQYLTTKKFSITLENATKIVSYTGGQVTYEDLLQPQEIESIKKIEPYEYTHNTYIENLKKEVKVT